jgi:hypothetical protein
VLEATVRTFKGVAVRFPACRRGGVTVTAFRTGRVAGQTVPGFVAKPLAVGAPPRQLYVRVNFEIHESNCNGRRQSRREGQYMTVRRSAACAIALDDTVHADGARIESNMLVCHVQGDTFNDPFAPLVCGFGRVFCAFRLQLSFSAM